MKLHVLSGFLGSGKTTAIENAAKYLLQKDIKAGVITNDQGTRLVDGDFFKSLKIPGEQVINSCFCCNYNDLNTKINSLIEKYDVDTIFAESVGSCTDIVATIFNPLSRFRPQVEVTVSTFADAQTLYVLLKGNQSLFDEDVKYIYYKQIQEAGVIVVSKVDLITSRQLKELKQLIRDNYKDKVIHYQNSFDICNIQQWLNLLDSYNADTILQSLQIDYDIYGSGEAKLAWLDQEIEINSLDNSAIQSTVSLINCIFNKIKKNNYSIGHLKFLIDEETKVSFTSSTPESYIVKAKDTQAASATLLINARVQTRPEVLSKIVAEAIEEEQKTSFCRIFVKSLASFKPGYPKPTYRIPAIFKSPFQIPKSNNINENNYTVLDKFFISLHDLGSKAFMVNSIEEVISLYQKSGPGIENILNTIPELGLINVEEINTIKLQTFYQIWVRGVLGVAENGAIWLENLSIIKDIFPFESEHLIIVLSADMIVTNMNQAYEKIKMDKERYGMFLTELSAPPKMDRSEVQIHKTSKITVYIIDKHFSKAQKENECGPECYC